MSERFPSGSTCYHQFSRWMKAGVFRQILDLLARDLEGRDQLDLSECFIGGLFVVAKNGGPKPEGQAGQRSDAHDHD